MNIRVSAEDAGWTIREAAWGFEEQVVWRGSDVARDALERAAERLQPLQRLVQTKLSWPLTDAFRSRGAAAQRGIAASAAALAIAAAATGAITAGGDQTTHNPAPPPAASFTAPAAGGDLHVLQGVTPQFRAGDDPVPAPHAGKPTAPPAQVAWRFAQAFVAYEVGRSSDKTTTAFSATATKPLAKALAADPPRLPAKGEVPQARVLNVVLGEGGKEQVTASVSLVRMKAISELRLTLTKDGNDWRVAQVLG